MVVLYNQLIGNGIANTNRILTKTQTLYANSVASTILSNMCLLIVREDLIKMNINLIKQQTF